MFVLPWIDRSKVRSGNFRPLFRKIYWIFIINALALGYMGSQPAEGVYLILGRICTLIYFAYFPVLWFISGREKTLPLPKSISEAVLAQNSNNAHH
jgi:ubiquinol-cytochrome c reductase cytochrome b subunit